AAGGATDVMARLVAQKMSENLRTTVFVENKAGGNFIPALRGLTGSPADGHTLFFISTSALITQPLHPDYPFDLTRLTPVTQVATGPLILVVRNDLPIKSVHALIDHANRNPGKLAFGAGGGTGSSLYLATELLKAKTGIKLTIVPYKGTGPALNDLIGGQFDFMCDQTLNVFQPLQGELIKAYAASTKKRLAVLPDLPTAAESGLADLEITVWVGMWTPKGTPKPVIDTLSTALQEALKDPDVANRLASAGAETVSSERARPEALRAHLKSEINRWTPIIKKAGVSAD